MARPHVHTHDDAAPAPPVGPLPGAAIGPVRPLEQVKTYIDGIMARAQPDGWVGPPPKGGGGGGGTTGAPTSTCREGWNLFGGDLSDTPLAPGDNATVCEGRCHADSACAAFVYEDCGAKKTCWLKKGGWKAQNSTPPSCTLCSQRVRNLPLPQAAGNGDQYWGPTNAMLSLIAYAEAERGGGSSSSSSSSTRAYPLTVGRCRRPRRARRRPAEQIALDEPWCSCAALPLKPAFAALPPWPTGLTVANSAGGHHPVQKTNTTTTHTDARGRRLSPLLSRPRALEARPLPKVQKEPGATLEVGRRLLRPGSTRPAVENGASGHQGRPFIAAAPPASAARPPGPPPSAPAPQPGSSWGCHRPPGPHAPFPPTVGEKGRRRPFRPCGSDPHVTCR